MPQLINSLRSWKSDLFVQTLKDELEDLNANSLPLDKSSTQGGYIDADSKITVSVFNVSEHEHFIQARIGVFFTEIITCCGCGDDPMYNDAYCQMQIALDKVTAETKFTVIPD